MKSSTVMYIVKSMGWSQPHKHKNLATTHSFNLQKIMTENRNAFPKEKISETFLQFSMPLIVVLGQDPSTNQIERILQLTYTVWNSMVLDKVRNSSVYVDALKKSLKSEPGALAIVEQLIARKDESFSNDLRLIGEYSFSNKGNQWHLKAEAKDPYKL